MPSFGETRAARLLKPKSHQNKSFGPKPKLYSVGDQISVRWIHVTWLMQDGLRGLGPGTPDIDFEFIGIK